MSRFVGSIITSRWYGRAKASGLTTLGLYGGWKARAAWEEAIDATATKPSSMLARLARVPGYFSGKSVGDADADADAKDRRITELEGQLHAAAEKNEELQMCLDAQSNRHEFPTSLPQLQRP